MKKLVKDEKMVENEVEDGAEDEPEVGAAQRMKRVSRYVDIPKSSIYQLLKEGKFPAPRHVGPRVVFWLTKELDEWLENCPKVDSK